jgi:ABC-2 type transport system ATP-binding protein
MTVFLTTHYLEEAEEADRICIINRGKVVSYGTPADVKGQLLESYLLLDANDRDRLVSELHQQGLAAGATPPFRVPLGRLTAQQIIKAINTPLSVLQVHTPTLEDAYLAIVDEGRDGT